MFNHARTLLLNIDGGPGYFPECPGEELIPGGYEKLELPTYLDVFRSRFFGADPDRAQERAGAPVQTLLQLRRGRPGVRRR